MSGKILIRFMKMSDLKQVKLLNEQTLPENYPYEFWLAMFNEGKKHSIVAIYESNVIGYVFCSALQILSFAVAESFRKKGIGQQILVYCLDTFIKAQRSVSLNVRVSNTAAFRLYRKLGFNITKENIGYYGNADSSRGPISPVENSYLMTFYPNGTLALVDDSGKLMAVLPQLPQKLKIK